MKIIEAGDIFDSPAQTIVNTVNCVGVMGKGLALKYKQRYPQMFHDYQRICNQGLLDIGKLWLYKTERRWILNFPTKYDWKQPSQLYFLERGLEKFMLTYHKKQISSIAFPLLGANNGGIDPEISMQIMQHYLKDCEIPVTIYKSFKRSETPLF